jgi:hypothetical protein
VAKSGKLALSIQDIREIKALYNWGMQVWMICAFYNIHKKTLHEYLKHFPESELPRRPNGQPKSFRSSRRQLHGAVVRQPDPFEDAYLIVREHARVLRDTRTEPRREDESIRSYREAVSVLRRACEHNDTRPLGPGLSSGSAPGQKEVLRFRRTVSAASLPPRAGACRVR